MELGPVALGRKQRPPFGVPVPGAERSPWARGRSVPRCAQVSAAGNGPTGPRAQIPSENVRQGLEWGALHRTSSVREPPRNSRGPPGRRGVLLLSRAALGACGGTEGSGALSAQRAGIDPWGSLPSSSGETRKLAREGDPQHRLQAHLEGSRRPQVTRAQRARVCGPWGELSWG